MVLVEKELLCSSTAQCTVWDSRLQAAEELAGTWDGVWGAWHTPALVYDGVSGCMEVRSKGSKLIFVSLES